uniref:Sec-independent protein translocase protein TatA n=1 Tax=Anthurium amnicola TaxID=1678845 RepID=A0A1D1XZL2_9ARAE
MAAAAMAAIVSTTLTQASPSCPRTRLSVLPHLASRSRCPGIQLPVATPRPGFGHLCTWSGLKHLGISCRYRNRGVKERYMGRVYASLFGVGAPEFLVIGVVALLVFGPKGLAEVARNLGKTLRAFQPTIRELQEVSREFKNTLEREIGLDEIPSSKNNSTYQSSSSVNENSQSIVDPNGTPSTKPYSTEELLKVTEEQLAASNREPQVQATNLEDQPQGVPDAQSSHEATNTVSTAQTAGSTSASEAAAQTNLVKNPENEGSKS